MFLFRLPITLLLCLIVVCYGDKEEEVIVMTEKELKLTLEAIENGLDFIGKEYKNVNLDALIGTRMVEGMFLICIV